MSLSGQLRKAIHDSDLSLYAIAKGAGIAYGVLHHFVSGRRDIRLETADKLVRLFGMQLTTPKRPKLETAAGETPRGKKGR